MKTGQTRRPSALFSFALGALLLSVSARAATIIFNEGFESTGVADAAFTSDWDGPNGTPFSLDAVSKGNLLNPAASGGTSSWLNPVPLALGNIFAVLHSGGTASANTGQTFTVGQTYTLTFTNFRRDDQPGDAIRASIGNSAGVLASADFAAVAAFDTLVAREVSYTATLADAGQPIFLRFLDTTGGSATSGQAGIDNIQLSVIPEPSTALLGGLGALCLLIRRRN